MSQNNVLQHTNLDKCLNIVYSTISDNCRNGDATKFAHIIGVLPKDVARSVEDILISLPASDQYSTLKKRLCSSFNPSTFESAHKLVSLQSSPTEKPSRVIDRMLNLLPSDTKPCWLFQYHFLQKLPQELRCKSSQLDVKDYVSKP